MTVPVILDFHPTAAGIRALTPVECGAFNRFALVDHDGNTIDVVGTEEMTAILRADVLAGIEDERRQMEYIDAEGASNARRLGLI